MKTNSNTAAVKNLKEMLAADFYNEIDLVKNGVQVYAYNLTGDEYNVIVKAERTKGRYYFTTREGYRLTWSSFTAEQLGIICRDFADQVKRETITTDTDHETTETTANMTAADIYEEMRTFAQHYATAYNCNLIASDALHDRQRFANWQNIAREADETTNPRAAFFFAIRKQGAESGTREHVAERCKVLGRPVYIMKVERATNANGEYLAGRFTVTQQFTKENDPSTTEAEREAERPTTLQAEQTTTETPAEFSKCLAFIVTANGVTFSDIYTDPAKAHAKADEKTAADPRHRVWNVQQVETTAEDLAELLEAQSRKESDELDNETDPARVPDWTRHAYEVAEMKRTGCTFGQARAKVAETRARILARREENNDKARRELRARAGSLVCKRDGYDRAYWQAIKDGDNAKADECARLEKEAADELAEVKKQLAELPAPLESAQDITDPDTADAVAAVVAKIENSPRPVVLFDNFAQTFEVSTKADPDGLHKWQALTAAGVESQGRATLQEVARMIAGE